MKISIIIPTYNSGGRVVELITQLKRVKFEKLQTEIIVVDDASNDNTQKLLKKITGIVLIRHKTNTGKGGAVRTGLAQASGDIFFIQDDDLEYTPAEIPKLIRPIILSKADVVYGSRRLNKKNTYSSPLYYFGGVLVDSIISFLLQVKLTDAITGSKAFTKQVYERISPLETNGFDIEGELTAKIIKAGFKPVEIPISYTPRSTKEGKNIRWHHAISLITAVLRYAYFR